MPYRIKHTPTGLYYQPHKHRGNNVSKKGKIYHTEGNAKSSLSNNTKYLLIRVQENSTIHKYLIGKLDLEPVSWNYGELCCKTPISEWEIEKMID
jgi:hypothetical protein